MIKIFSKIVSVFLATLIFCSASYGEESTFEGRWIISLQDKKRVLEGLLEIENINNEWRAYLEGGPVSIEISNNNIVLIADSRDVRGFVFDRKMIGKIDKNIIKGTYTQEGAAAQKEDPGPWRAEREKLKIQKELKPNPSDISGLWVATQQLDFRKYTMALTPNGKKWLENYLPYYDQPDVRCESIGLPALVTYTFPFEIIASEDRYTMIYEYQSKVRRIWMDRRKPSQFMPPSRMGHSTGHWEGDTLVVDTVNLEKTIRDFRGELISEKAHIQERYNLNDSGDVLTAIITVKDPNNYKRFPIRRRQWIKSHNAEIFPYTCDPDSFFIPMYEQNEMDMYIKRTDRRF